MSTRSRPGDGGPGPALDEVTGERGRLINLAYRLLGSLAEAEDAVQETYTRWYAMTRAQQEAIDNPAAWLTTVGGRVCLNVLGSARARREAYVGEWIPEPLPDPGEWLDRRSGGASTDPAARQAGIVRDFKQAWEDKDIGALVGLLDPDATAVADGGGLVTAVVQAVEGRERIARACVDVAGRPPGLTVRERIVNGQPGLIAEQDGRVAAVLAFAIEGDLIKHLWVVLNPEKLRPWQVSGR